MNRRARPRLAFELVFALSALGTTLPLFAGRYIPLQDLPQHVAAVRVLHDFRVEALGFERFFELSLTSTQYLSVYLLAHVVAHATGVLLAMKLVLGAALVGLPYALRALLRALGRPESLALLALPLAYNAHLVLGFLNFVAALPLMFWGLALAVRVSTTEASRSARVGLSLLALACFFTHVVPYGVLLAGTSLLFARDSVRASLMRGLPLVPSLMAVALWLRLSPVAAELTTLARGQTSLLARRSAGSALEEAPLWLTDVFWSGHGRQVLTGWILIALFVAVVANAPWLDRALSRSGAWRDAMSVPGAGTRELSTTASTKNASASARLFGLVPLACLGYWLLPESFAFVWPIHARFPLLALLCLIPVLPKQSASLRAFSALACVALTFHGTLGSWRAFRSAVQNEYAGLPEIVAQIPQGSRVAGLIYARGSEYVKFSPYLHAVAWVQAERGGAVMFSFAEFPASPFRFREDNRPPPVAPRWEWMPERVDPVRDLAFFEYVLTRAGPTRLSGFRALAKNGGWSLFGRP